MIGFKTLSWGGVTLAIMIGCYTVSLQASGERKAVDNLRLQIAGDLRGIDILKAELRTRARMPELQRWNDEVLGLTPAAAGQFVHDPVQLLAFETPDATAKPAAPTVQYAVADAPAPAAAPSPVHTVAYVPEDGPTVTQAPVLDTVNGFVADARNTHATLQRVAMR